MTRSSLRLRLLLAGALAIALVLAASASALLVLFERHVTRRIDAELNVHLTQLIAGLDRSEQAGGAIELARRPAEPRFDRPLSGLYWQIVVGPERHVLRSRSLWDGELALPDDDLDATNVHTHALPGPGGAMLHVLERRAALPERIGGVNVRAAVAIDAAELDRATRDFAHDLLPMLVLFGALLLLAGWAQVSIGLWPLSRVRDKLALVRTGVERRLGKSFPEEVRPLAEQVDALLDARDADLEKARRRVADLAHGLKTPLQVLIGEARRLEARGDDSVATEIMGLAETMQRNIGRELQRARMAPSTTSAAADVAEVVRRVVSVVRRTPTGSRVEWAIDIDPAIRVRLDADDLAEALGNLLENAAAFALSRVSVTAHGNGQTVSIVVADDGVGIRDDQIADAVRRGGRLDTTRQGTGLGLAIVSEMATHAGGALVLDDANPGLRATLRLEKA